MLAGNHPSGTGVGFSPVMKTGLFEAYSNESHILQQSGIRFRSFTPARRYVPGCCSVAMRGIEQEQLVPAFIFHRASFYRSDALLSTFLV